MLFNLWRDFWRNPWQARFMLPLIVINLAGSVYGYYWYAQQLASTPFYYWPFVSDSPFSTTLFTFALIARLRGWRNDWLPVVAFVCCLKYGFWAVVLISHYWFAKGTVTPVETALWLSHWGMVLEGWAYLHTLELKRTAVVGSVFWLAANDFLDYAGGLHPYLFTSGQLPVAMVTAIGLTLMITLILFFKKRNIPQELRIRNPGRE